MPGLLRQVTRQMSVMSNQPMEMRQLVDMRQKVYDVNLLHYDWMNQALGERRFITKSEVGSKVFVIDPPECPPLLAQLLSQKVDWTEQEGKESDRRMEEGSLDSHYLRAVMGESHLNTLLEEYSSKVLLNGYTVPLSHQRDYQDTLDRVMGLYQAFFHGHPLSSLEYFIHLRYLSCKHQKYRRFLKIKHDKDFKQEEKRLHSCVWTQENHRRINFHENFHVRDLRLYDDYRPFFRPVDYQAFPVFQELLRGLEKSKEQQGEVRQCQANNLFQFTREYVYSIELTSGLQLMPDHQMEYSLLHTHIWMLMERLRLLSASSESLPEYLYLATPQHTLRLRAHLLRIMQSHLHSCDV